MQKIINYYKYIYLLERNLNNDDLNGLSLNELSIIITKSIEKAEYISSINKDKIKNELKFWIKYNNKEINCFLLNNKNLSRNKGTGISAIIPLLISTSKLSSINNTLYNFVKETNQNLNNLVDFLILNTILRASFNNKAIFKEEKLRNYIKDYIINLNFKEILLSNYDDLTKKQKMELEQYKIKYLMKLNESYTDNNTNIDILLECINLLENHGEVNTNCIESKFLYKIILYFIDESQYEREEKLFNSLEFEKNWNLEYINKLGKFLYSIRNKGVYLNNKSSELNISKLKLLDIKKHYSHPIIGKFKILEINNDNILIRNEYRDFNINIKN